jgi:hypothetical protein
VVVAADSSHDHRRRLGLTPMTSIRIVVVIDVPEMADSWLDYAITAASAVVAEGVEVESFHAEVVR